MVRKGNGLIRSKTLYTVVLLFGIFLSTSPEARVQHTEGKNNRTSMIREIHLLSYDRGHEFQITYNSEKEIEAIGKILTRNNYFDLQDQYVNMDIRDGSHDAIVVVFFDGTEKKVHVINNYPAEFRQIQREIAALGFEVPRFWPRAKSD